MTSLTRLGLFLFIIASWCGVALGQQPAPEAPPAVEAPTVTASPTVAPTLTPSPLPTPVPTPTVLMLPADAPPEILWYSISPKSPHSGEVVLGIVLASSNVASVEIRIAGYGFNLPKTDVGRFEGRYRVPKIPFFMSHRFTMRIIARNTAGARTEDDLQMQIR